MTRTISENFMKKIYLDYAATSPVKKEVLKAMMPYFCDKFGNPSSIHSFGREARPAVEKSRKTIADFLNCNSDEIIFTSGGTESDNLAIRGLINMLGNNVFLQAPTPALSRDKSRDAASENIISSHINKSRWDDSTFSTSPKGAIQLPHIITSAFEHHAVLETCKDLEARGLAEVTYIKPNYEGIISVESVKKAIKSNTILVSIMYVNNEIGTIQPTSGISNVISKINHQRSTINKPQRGDSTISTFQHIFFHSDAVQAIEYQDCDVKKLGVDMLTLSAHKFGGPKGVGVLYVKKSTPIHHENIGGAQEFKLRAGTENVPNIIGMAKAIQLLNLKFKIPASPAGRKNLKLAELRDYFIDRILSDIPDTFLNGSRKLRSPNNINISFKYIEGEAILLHLDEAGIAASSGSACTSGSLEPSHVLLSIGLKHEDAHGSIRFTLGKKTTKKEIDYTINQLKKIVKKLREMSPYTAENMV